MPRKRISVKRRLELFLAFVAVTIVYLLLGAGLMVSVEADREEYQARELQKEIAAISMHLNGSDEVAAHVQRLEELGVCNFHAARHWSFTGSCFYCLTVVTTIGYGSFAPSTIAGMVITGFYAFFGISIIGQLIGSCAALLKGVVHGIMQRVRQTGDDDGSAGDRALADGLERMKTSTGAIPTECLGDCLALLLQKQPNAVLVQYVKEQVDPEGEGELSMAQLMRAVSLWYEVNAELPRGVTGTEVLIAFGSSLCWIVLWAGVFAKIENWNFIEGVWFCFVTISTIGFGDFTPQTELGRLLSFVFIVPGLGFCAAALSVLWDMFEERRFWWLQEKHAQGRVSAKMLEAHGISCHLKTLPSLALPRRTLAPHSGLGKSLHLASVSTYEKMLPREETLSMTVCAETLLLEDSDARRDPESALAARVGRGSSAALAAAAVVGRRRRLAPREHRSSLSSDPVQRRRASPQLPPDDSPPRLRRSMTPLEPVVSPPQPIRKRRSMTGSYSSPLDRPRSFGAAAALRSPADVVRPRPRRGSEKRRLSEGRVSPDGADRDPPRRRRSSAPLITDPPRRDQPVSTSL